ncbi:zinc-binding dehydrogenase [Pseudonocardia halophobica]|uniref:zinc-binding dehydrogenase n=1 Tax=Pseudonocardia halophobica TaxID=29401 RepID=UPI003D8F9941
MAGPVPARSSSGGAERPGTRRRRRGRICGDPARPGVRRLHHRYRPGGDRQAALDFGANEFLDLNHEDLDDIGRVDLVFDVIGGDIQRRSARIIRPGGTLVSVVGPVDARPVDGLAVDFVVESVPSQLREIVDRVRNGRLRTHVGTVATLDEAIPALNPTERRKGKTVIRVRP